MLYWYAVFLICTALTLSLVAMLLLLHVLQLTGSTARINQGSAV